MPSPHSTTPPPTAIVTGASSGIGRALCHRLAHLGYRLAMIARQGERLEVVANECSSLGAPDILIRATDMGIPADVEAMIDACLEAFGRIDALVNNAGIAELELLGALTRSMLERTIAVNLLGPIIAVNRLWPSWTQQAGIKRIINVSSMSAQAPFAGFTGYGASKSGLNSLTRSINEEGKSLHILAFTVAPGAVETPALRALFDEHAIPRDQTLSPDDVAGVIASCLRGERDKLTDEPLWLVR